LARVFTVLSFISSGRAASFLEPKIRLVEEKFGEGTGYDINELFFERKDFFSLFFLGLSFFPEFMISFAFSTISLAFLSVSYTLSNFSFF